MKRDNWEAEYLHVLGNASRIKILKFLKKGTKYSRDIAKHLGQSRSTASRHLKMLYSVGIIEREQDTNETRYYILDKEVFEILSLIPKGLVK